MVSSPNYPDRDYPNNLKKTQTIQVKEGMVLMLDFTEFDIQSHGDSSCDWDNLTITDGDGTMLLKESCGTEKPPQITSSTRTVNISFQTDETITRNGWSINWKAMEPGKREE